MSNPFWKSTRILLQYKRLLAIAFLGAIVSAACFGAGISMILPVVKLFFSESGSVESRHEIADQLLDPKNPEHVRQTGHWMMETLDEHRQPPVQELIQKNLLRPENKPWQQAVGRWLIDRMPRDEFQTFMLLMAVIAVLTVIGSTGRYVHESLTLTVIYRCAQQWRAQMVARLMHAPMVTLQRSGTGDYMSRLLGDTNVLVSSYQAVMAKTAAEGLKGLFTLGAAFFINWRLTSLALIGFIPIGLILRKFGKRIQRATKRALSAQGSLLRALKESLDSIAVVKVHDAEGYERRRFARLNRERFRQEMRIRRTRALSAPLIETLALFGVMIIAIIAAWFIFRHGERATEFIVVLGLLAASGNSFKLLGNVNNQIAEGSAAAERIYEVLAVEQEPIGLAARTDLPTLPRHQREVRFDHISFSYPGQERPAVNDASLSVTFGQTTAFVGGNGSGKTTLLHMLPRLIEPSSGCILIDEVNIRSVNLRSLRRQIAIVSQQSVLYQGSIAANIAYGRRWLPRERIVAAAKAAFAHEFITALPAGYDTPLSEGGTGLSGGQRQRICIARALVRDPAILILDEATSQIDSDSEAKITQAIRALRHTRTIFIIAHRLSTVVDADCIVVMDAGVVVDMGTHDQLLKRCRIYQTLTQNQFVTAAAVE